MSSLAFEAGAIFADRYRIVRTMASGGMGAVYEVVHIVTQRRCALKVMHGHTIEREELRRRFLQESQVAAQIGSEYIVDILDAGVDEKTKIPFLIMELLEGEDLGRRIVRIGHFEPAEALRYLWDAALALEKTHRASIVHRDLKASNLFLTTRGDGSPIVKVLDFGVAKVLPTHATSEGATQTVGTPIYMAPEQFRAGGRVSPATDIYALGMLAYTLLVGAHYWREEHLECDNPFAFASIAVHGPKESAVLRAHREGVSLPEGFDFWFSKATSQKPGARYGSAIAAVRALGRLFEVPLPDPPSDPYSSVDQVSLHTPISGPAILPETIESASAWSQPGLEVPSQPSGVPSQPSQNGALAGEAHTEVSLSVTSGQLSALPAKSSRRYVVTGATLIVALAAVTVGALLTRSTPVDVAPAAAASGSSVPTSLTSASPPATPERAAPETPREPLDISDLPVAEPARPAAPSPPPGRYRPSPRSRTPSVKRSTVPAERVPLYGQD